MIQLVRFADFVEINPKVELNRGEEYPFIDMAIVEPGRRYVRAIENRIYSGGGSKFSSGDVLFARITPCLENGKIVQFKDYDKRKGFGSTEFFIFRAKKQISDSSFIYYLVLTDTIRKPAEKSMSGASGRQRANLTSIVDIKIQLFPLPTQQKIAAILSAYDDLIENNTRRIKILEEMAQAIYREWFVNFRFHGHEGVQMEESELGPVPKGWEVKRLDEVAEVIDCLHGIKPTEVINDDEKFGILLHVWNIGDEGKLDLLKKFFITEEVYRLWTKRIEVKEGDCVITNVGRIGAVAQIPFDLTAAIGRNMTAIRGREGIITPTYLIEYLRSPYFEREKNLKQDLGTVMGSLNVKGIIRLNIPIPSLTLVKEFETSVRPFRYRIEIFQKQNDNLRRTRDLLLPKLISGEIDVSGLDIRTPEAEA